MEIINHLFNSSGEWLATSARLTIGLIMLAHGMHKVFGRYGGEGMQFNLLMIRVALVVLLLGSGNISIDDLLNF